MPYPIGRPAYIKYYSQVVTELICKCPSLSYQFKGGELPVFGKSGRAQ